MPTAAEYCDQIESMRRQLEELGRASLASVESEPSKDVRPPSPEREAMMRTLRDVNRASTATACVAGCVVSVELSRHVDRRSLQARLLIADAERLHEQLGQAIAAAKAHQQELDLTDAEIALAQSGGAQR